MEKVLDTVRAEIAELTENVKSFAEDQKAANAEYVSKVTELMKDVNVHNILDKQKALVDLNTVTFTKGLSDVVNFNMKLMATTLDKSKAVFDFAKHRKSK